LRILIPANFRRSVAHLTVDDVDQKTGLAVRRPAGTVLSGAGNPGIGFGLLGLMHGHYRHMQTIGIDAGGQTIKGKVDQNRGISIVIPAQDILDVLNNEEFVKQREWRAA
jgi:hypothetical protein